MRLGIALIHKDIDTNKNLNNLLVNLKAATNHHVDMVLFPKDFLNSTPIDITDMFLFSIKQACILFDITCGFGFIEQEDTSIFSSYLVINQQGEVLNHARMHEENEPFVMNDLSFTLHFGDQQTFSSNGINILILGDSANEKQWFNERLDIYKQIADGYDVLGINQVDDHHFGGAFYIHNNTFDMNQPTGQYGLNLFDIEERVL